METIDDIIREMREMAMTQNCVDSAEGLALASRIEAAINPTIMAAQAEVMCRDGVPMERFNGVVMELTQARDEIAMLRAALAPVLACDTNAIGAFPLLVEPNAKVDIYQSNVRNIDELCGGTRTPAEVFRADNLLVAECPKAVAIADALNAVAECQRIYGEGKEEANNGND